MNMPITSDTFQNINRGYNSAFQINNLSVGLVVPLESYPSSSVPTMANQLKRIQLAEALGFSAVWLRDVPFNVPSFGDAGQVFDPWVYLGLLAGQTSRIALGVASIILPLRHPAHVAKAAASVDALSDGRLILGIASGDRPDEYPAMNLSYGDRGERFRESFNYIKAIWENYPAFQNHYGNANSTIDLLPKPSSGKLPLLVTGSSQQSSDWIAKNSDGWITYPRNSEQQEKIIRNWRAEVSKASRMAQPIMQPLYIDLAENPDTQAQPIHLGFRCGSNYLKGYLKNLEKIGVNHVALNLRFHQGNMEKALDTLAKEVLPAFKLKTDT